MSDLEFEFMTSEQKADNDVIIMGHSGNAIFSVIADCKHTPEEHATIDRNVGHLEHMLLQDHIVNHPSDKSAFHSAIAAGKEHLA